MEEQTLIRKIDSMSSDVHFHHGNILMTIGPRISWPGLSYQSYARFTDIVDIQFWNLSQLIDPNIDIEKVKNRVIKTVSKSIEASEICQIYTVGSVVLTLLGNQLTQRSFWP